MGAQVFRQHGSAADRALRRRGDRAARRQRRSRAACETFPLRGPRSSARRPSERCADPGNRGGGSSETAWNARLLGRRRFTGRGVPFGFPSALPASSWNSGPPAMDPDPPAKAFHRVSRRPLQNLPGTLQAFQPDAGRPDVKPDGTSRRGGTCLPRPATFPRRLSSVAGETGGNASPGKSTAAKQSSVPNCFSTAAILV